MNDVAVDCLLEMHSRAQGANRLALVGHAKWATEVRGETTQRLYIIFQIDWKRYIIVLAKYLPSLLHLEIQWKYLATLLLWRHMSETYLVTSY